MKAKMAPKMMPMSSPLERPKAATGEADAEVAAVEVVGAVLVGGVLVGVEVEWENEDDVRGVAVKVELGATGAAVGDATGDGDEVGGYKPPQVHAPSVPRGICTLVSYRIP